VSLTVAVLQAPNDNCNPSSGWAGSLWVSSLVRFHDSDGRMPAYWILWMFRNTHESVLENIRNPSCSRWIHLVSSGSASRCACCQRLEMAQVLSCLIHYWSHWSYWVSLHGTLFDWCHMPVLYIRARAGDTDSSVNNCHVEEALVKNKSEPRIATSHGK